MRRRLNLLLLILMMLPAVGVLTTCADYTADSQDGRVVIRYWEKWTGFEKEAMEAIVDKYNQSQDKVFVRFISTSQIDRKLLLATAGGNPPDVAGFWSHALVSYAEKGALLPLDSRMERDGLSTDDYVESVIDACTYRGYTWGLPATPATVALHYNKDFFREIGRDPDDFPQTLEGFNELAKEMTQVGENGHYKQMGFLPVDPGWWGQFWGFWFGADLISEDGKEILCDSPENIEAFKWFRSFIEDYNRAEVRFFEASHRGQFASPSNSFMSGRIGMKLQGVWMANFIETFGPDVDWAAVPLPKAPGVSGGPATVVETDILVIPRGAKHIEEAWDFIKFVQRQENIEELCLLQRKFSPRKEVSEEFYEKHENPYIRLFRELAESENAKAVPKTPIWTEYRDELGVAVEQLWVTPESQLSVEDALRRVKQRIQPKLDRANERWEAIGEQRIREWDSL